MSEIWKGVPPPPQPDRKPFSPEQEARIREIVREERPVSADMRITLIEQCWLWEAERFRSSGWTLRPRRWWFSLRQEASVEPASELNEAGVRTYSFWVGGPRWIY